VLPFAIDTVPVSSADFLRFTLKQPRWSRSQIPASFADDTYLSGVIDDATRPVTQVSWFAADAYCSNRGARLPSTNEWEFVARASETDRDAASQPGFRQRILELAMAAAPATSRIGSGFRNVWGVRDMHGGVMEWTADVLTIFTGDAHGNSQSQHTMACSAGAVETGDASDYAAFMRYALRRSIEGRNTVANVGFRCAASL
jgi:formylglycine-generating enzyme required for sulfatase activity